MNMKYLIEKKKLGKCLTGKEIDEMVQGYVRGKIPDYQMSAFLMAVCFKGMTEEETANLTLSFVNSGDKIDLSDIKGIKVDKHSSGGVGDKISLIVVPLVAALGIPVPKISGRGLGHTGGTIDKLEAIEGFNVQLSKNDFINNVNRYKMAIASQTSNLTPADKKIYALRDVTSTVDSIPLIASSIMSKKIASGADAIVLDVKLGSGAFMKSLDEARILAKTMVNIGKSLNKKTIALITDMNQPLGYEVGNANEVKEAIEVLKGNGALDETLIALTIASHMAVLGGIFQDVDTAYMTLEKVIKSGDAAEKFKQLIKIQGGNPCIVDNPKLLPQSKNHISIKANTSGYIYKIQTESIGMAAMLLGAGRAKKDDVIDLSAGITMSKKVGDSVLKGDTLCILHSNMDNCIEAEKIASNAFSIKNIKPPKIQYIYDVIE